ncbi:hypothetical protein [Photobacterium leiognathi]|uniref:hypothetical protein n=1 Tax=Photobacterium leiognathi TaxID=553611 RepID=UPI002980CB77|nr:hypothetical protein [Photobacterium leiognathi]
MSYFTGIGSSNTPLAAKELMSAFTKLMFFTFEMHLRSGGAPAADSYFEGDLADGDMQIIRPQGKVSNPKHFSVEDPELIMKSHALILNLDLLENFKEMLNSPSSLFAVQAHTRNPFQVLGPKLNPDDKSKFLVCWTEGGGSTLEDITTEDGGSRTAMRLAAHHGIPIFNLNTYDGLKKIWGLVSTFCPNTKPFEYYEKELLTSNK